MAKKKVEDAPIKTDGWMATFSDLMNLLLCFFVLLFAMSTVDTEKWQQLVASLSSSYSILESNGGTGVEEGMLIASGASQLAELSTYYAQMKDNQEGNKNEIEDALIKLEQMQQQESEEMGEVIDKFLENKGLGSEVEIQVTQHYVCLKMKGSLMFEPASADLTGKAKKVLSEVSQILKMYEDNLIEIEGHTDNVPIYDKLYTSNDLLSDYRALAVFQDLVNDNNVSPNKLKHSGRGEYDPIASNDTAEGRAQNRRVEIKIYNSYSSH